VTKHLFILYIHAVCVYPLRSLQHVVRFRSDFHCPIRGDLFNSVEVERDNKKNTKLDSKKAKCDL